ncbi:MAG: uroporphyrinogen decarboxylase [Alphaproteobacteria bacterium]|nr:uroporphyrinogen decarboxylase [Alphaproteobacteria bacterium]
MTSDQKEKRNGGTPGANKALLRVLAGEQVTPAPIWIMRQAGRYLPEYRELRTRAKSFLEFCYAPALAVEATLQPLRRFDLDAAILFSDILTIPDALGRKVWFVDGEGPRLDPLIAEARWRFDEPERAVHRLAPVYETVERVRSELADAKTLIGFAGGPWTVATYMLQGEGGPKDRALACADARADDVDALLLRLAEATAQHLAAQLKAGADCVQVFESWAENLTDNQFDRLVIAPTVHLITRLRAHGATAPVIGFPRAAAPAQIARYAAATGVAAIGLDTSASATDIRARINRPIALQGNLDPRAMVEGGADLEAGAAKVLADFAGGPHIFNLGHGITPDAKPENVARLIEIVKSGA